MKKPDEVAFKHQHKSVPVFSNHSCLVWHFMQGRWQKGQRSGQHYGKGSHYTSLAVSYTFKGSEPILYVSVMQSYREWEKKNNGAITDLASKLPFSLLAVCSSSPLCWSPRFCLEPCHYCLPCYPHRAIFTECRGGQNRASRGDWRREREIGTKCSRCSGFVGFENDTWVCKSFL